MIPLDEKALDAYFKGKMQRSILGVYKRLSYFIRKNSVILEDVHKRLEIIRAISFGKISEEFMHESLRDDYAEAQKAMDLYNKTIKGVEFWLVNLNSSYNMGKFLRDSGIPPGDVNITQKELDGLWQFTYGKHLERFEKVQTLLLKLKVLLQQQIWLLKGVGETNFLRGFTENQKINLTFEEERKTFWELAKVAQVTTTEINETKQALETQIIKAKAKFKAIKRIMEKDYEVDMQDRTAVERQVVRLNYLLGSLALIRDIPDDMQQKSMRSGWGWLMGANKKDKELTSTGQMLSIKLVKVAKGVVPIPL
ncbi:hypothetical protein HOD38_02850 [archaeon]|jgi:hypothetical protein|nr:hypothetical protein [archaeon]MBT4397180.1 hypothetical protein [archaeon]MBT4440560.1 hypothetical protein [archaeon]